MGKLYINNQLANIGQDKDVDIKLNRDFINQSQIDARVGDYSYTIKIPKNDENNIIFQSANVINVIDKFVKTEEYQGKYVTNDGTAITGFLKLSKITEQFYECALISNNVAWAKLIQGKNLNELKNFDGSDWEFLFTGSYLSTTPYTFQWYNEDDNTSFAKSDILFPLIPRGPFFHSANTSLNHFYPDSLSILDIPPAVYEQKIIKKIFENISWTIDSDLFNDPEHQKAFLAYTSGDKYGWNYLAFGHSVSSGITSGTYYNYDYTVGSGATYPYGHYISSFHYEQAKNSSTQLNWFTPNTVIQNGVNLFNFRYDNISLTNLSGATPGPITGTEYFSSVDEIPFTINLNVTFTGLTYSGNNVNHSHIYYGQVFPDNLKKAVTILYIHDDDYLKEIMNDIGDYYKGTVSAITHPNVIFAHDFLASYYDFPNQHYFTPYSTGPNTADQIPGDVSILNALNVYQTTEIHGYPVFENFTVEHLQGSLEFQLRNVILLEGQYIRAATVYPSAGITCAGTTRPLRGGPVFKAALYQQCDLFEFIPPTSGATYSSNINIGANLPEMSQLDFLKDWISRNNLYISYNQDTKLVRFDTDKGFFLPNSHAIDLTELIDLKNGEPVIMPMKLPRNLYFKYSNDTGDLLIKQDPDYANLQCTSDNIYTEGTSTISSLFSSTRTSDYRYFAGASAGTFSQVTLPTIMTDTGSSDTDMTQIQWVFNTTPRILKDDGYLTDSSGNTLYIMVDGIPSKIRNSRFEDTRSEDKLNLCFNGDNGLYQTRYSRSLNQIADSHIVEYQTRINTNHYNKLLPQYPVKVGSQHYILNKIDAFNPEKVQSTKIQLIKKFTN